jgi:hypothetical protein
MRFWRPTIVLLALASMLAALAHAARRPTPPLDHFKAIKTPAGTGSGQPYLAVAADGSVFLSWLEVADSSRRALRIARLTNGVWGEALTVAKGDSFFVNSADVPVMAALGSENLMIAWLWKTAGEGYQVRLSGSIDGGRHWTPPVIPHRDDTPTEHGFVSLVPAHERGLRVFWLDGRKYANSAPDSDTTATDRHAETSLRTAWVGFDGAMDDEREVDDRVCDCCPTAAIGRGPGALVAYRDRTRDEVRDISIAWLDAGGWSDPAPVHADGWKTASCPVNGPAMDAIKDHVAVAWFTEKGDKPRAYVAFSANHGRDFDAPIRIDEGNPLGRMCLVLLESGDALVGWMEARGSAGLFQVRRVSPTGAASASMTVARTVSSRASGIPRMVRTGDRVHFAWTATEGAPQVRVAVGRVRP